MERQAFHRMVPMERQTFHLMVSMERHTAQDLDQEPRPPGNQHHHKEVSMRRQILHPVVPKEMHLDKELQPSDQQLHPRSHSPQEDLAPLLPLVKPCQWPRGSAHTDRLAF